MRPLRPIAILFLASALFGCEEEDQPTQFVARVGDQYFLEEDLDRALASLPAALDSSEARQQIVDQWVTSELMYQEALRRDLRDDEEVQRLLQEAERSVLINALLSRIYEENPVSPSPSELQAYFERNKEQLRLRETFVRVRYLETSTRAEAEEARRLLQRAGTEEADSVWTRTIERLATAPTAAGEISSSYFPESRMFLDKPALRDVLGQLLDAQTAPIIDADSAFHVLQLVERVPPRTIPQAEWVQEELVRRLVIQERKQLYSRQVQRLRNEALAREDLVVR